MDSKPWHGLHADVADVIEPELPALADAIITGISEQVPEYARPLEGGFGRGVRRGVDEALGQFVHLIRDPGANREAGRGIYVELGRGELRQGRTLDALQSAYRVGARIAWRNLAEAGARAGLDQTTMSLLAESIFAYIDEMSADSVEGFADALSERQGERLRRQRRMVLALLEDPPAPLSDLRGLAASAGWRLPERAAAIACHETDLAEITRRLPSDVISATVEATGCVIVPDAAGPGRRGHVSRAVADRTAALGPESEPRDLADSWRIARLALRAADRGVLQRAGLISSEEHLVDLAIFKSGDLIRHLRASALEPFAGLTPKARERMGSTALAYIEQRGNAAEMARALHIHPQTARYRVAKLRDLFGDRLDEPDGRLALELALRSDRAGV